MIHFYLKKRRKSPNKPASRTERRLATQAGPAPEPTPDFCLEVEFAIMKGSFVGVLGPSGSGKSTLIRCLAGLEKPDDGFVKVDDGFWYNAQSGLNLRPQLRSIGMVFQDYALFPHLSALGNVMFARNDRRLALEWLGRVGLADQVGHFPRELSGGQSQRVALARALARQPQLLLLDEPLSALDEELREELGDLLRRVQRETGTTALMVSHSRQEIGRLCDEVLEIKQGRLVNDRYPVP